MTSGPHQFNFSEAMSAFAEAGALQTVSDVEALIACTDAWLCDDDQRRRDGAAGLEVIEQQRGATERVLELIRARIDAAILQ